MWKKTEEYQLQQPAPWAKIEVDFMASAVNCMAITPMGKQGTFQNTGTKVKSVSGISEKAYTKDKHTQENNGIK